VRPTGTPIGLQLAHSAKHVGRAFNDALAEVGGSMPMWFILSNLKGEAWRTQHELARALRIEGPTLTRHLDGLEEDGLVVRRRDTSDRRAVSVELTDAGRARHAEMLRAVQAFNRQLLAGLDEAEIEELARLLTKLEQNARAGTNVKSPAG
jgi:MarR family transcriptional regulator for hemolysin